MVIFKNIPDYIWPLALPPSLISLHSLPSACTNHHHLTVKPKWHGQQPTCNHTETRTTTRNIMWVSKGRHFGPRHNNRHSHTWQLAATAPSTLHCILLSEGMGSGGRGLVGGAGQCPANWRTREEAIKSALVCVYHTLLHLPEHLYTSLFLTSFVSSNEIYLSGFNDGIRWKRFSWSSRPVLDLIRQKCCGRGSREGVNFDCTCMLS